MNRKTFTSYFPLWGVSFDSNERGNLGGRVNICRPYPVEWRKILKEDIVRAFECFYGTRLNITDPIPCISITMPQESEVTLKTARLDHLAAVQSDSDDAVTVLRLLKPGWFMDPRFAEYTFMSSDYYIEREPGPYRQLMFRTLFEPTAASYSLSINELRRTLEEETPASRLWSLLQNYRQSGKNAAIEIALTNFNLSYSLHVSNSQKLGFLFTALDAIFGGMSLHKKKGKLYLRNTLMKDFFEDRLFHFMTLIEDPKAKEDIAWIKKHMRSLRNKIAHGSLGDNQKLAGKHHERMLDLLRRIIPAYLKFCTFWNQFHDRIQESLELAPEGQSLVEAFNKAISRSIANDAYATQLLQSLKFQK